MIKIFKKYNKQYNVTDINVIKFYEIYKYSTNIKINPTQNLKEMVQEDSL
jgi:hypothetical protein